MSYQFDHAWHAERARLAALEAAFDPWSMRTIMGADPRPGWRCLDVGAGGGSIAERLCQIVGPQGEVVATDVETKFLQALTAPNLRVLQHDVVTDPLEEEGYDLIHVRAVLAHLPQRDAVVQKLIEALRPGGWLVAVVADFSTVRATDASPDDAAFFDRSFASVIDAARVIGFDPFYGRRIGAVLRAEGLHDTHVEGVILEWHGGHALADLYGMTFQRLRELVVGKGVISADDHARLLSLMGSTDFFGLSNTLYLGRGRKPA
ncbi:MAG: methyltransferase [Gemmatimonadota bacterium]